MNTPSEIIHQSLAGTCRRKDTFRRVAWLLLVLAVALIFTLGSAAVDYWLVLPIGVRTATALVLGLFLLAGLVRFIQFLRRPTSIKEAALDVEAAQPGIGCTVSTAAEYLRGERKIVNEYEPQLVAVLQARAAGALQQAFPPYRKVTHVPLALLATAMLFLLGFVSFSSNAFTALKRVTWPSADDAYTRVDVTPGHLEIPVGKDVDVTGVFEGRPPKDPLLHWRAAGQPDWRTTRLSAREDGRLAHLFESVQQPLEYRITGSDAVSDVFRISTYHPPAVRELLIQLDYPAYVGRESIQQRSTEIAMLRGSEASFRLAPTAPLTRARLRFDRGVSVDLKPASSHDWLGRIPIRQDLQYWIELTDKQGRVGVNDDPYHIKALPDLPPVVEILEPGEDIRAQAAQVIPVRISVTDDFGVGDIRLVYHKLGGPENTLVATRVEERSGEIIARVEMPLAPLELNDYELVAYHAEASDNNTLDGPGVGKSPLFFLEVTPDGQGGSCLSQCSGQKVNLLVIQKQIIADTQALEPPAASGSYREIQEREREAIYFGNLYLGALQSGAPAEAVQMMKAALEDMQAAVAALGRRQRQEALPPEESALARFYQILKLLPELENLPTSPPPAQGASPSSPMIKVVLEAIRKDQQNNSQNKEIAELLEQLQQLQRSQSGLNQACPNPSASPNGGGSPRDGQASRDGPAANPKNSASTGEPDPEQMSREQEALSREAAALAERLAKLAGKDGRLGHNLTRTMNGASPKMKAAALAMKGRNWAGGYANGREVYFVLNTVISMLEKILEQEGRLADVSAESFPKEYGPLIQEYLKRLSYQE